MRRVIAGIAGVRVTALNRRSQARGGRIVKQSADHVAVGDRPASRLRRGRSRSRELGMDIRINIDRHAIDSRISVVRGVHEQDRVNVSPDTASREILRRALRAGQVLLVLPSR